MSLIPKPQEVLYYLKKPLQDRFKPVLELLGHHQRRWHRHNGRLYLELKDLESDKFPAYAKKVQKALKASGQASWVQVHPHLGQVIVEKKSPKTSPKTFLKILERVETEMGIKKEPFFSHRLEIPADEVPLYRLSVEIWADAFSMLISLLHKILISRPFALEVDVAALFSLMENTPRLREYLEERYEPAAVDLALNLGNSLAQGLAQGPLSPGVDMVKRLFLIKENLARRASWKEREKAWVGSHPAEFPWLSNGKRAAPLPQGFIEEYSDKAWYASLGAFGLGAVTTRSLQKAAGALFGGLPKPAYLGREAFTAQFTQRLASQGTVVLVPEALRRLDRVNCWVVDGELLLEQAAYLKEIIPLGRSKEESFYAPLKELFDPLFPQAKVRKKGWSLLPLQDWKGSLPPSLKKNIKDLAFKTSDYLILRHHNRTRAVIKIQHNPPEQIHRLLTAIRQSKNTLVIATNHPEVFSKFKADKIIKKGSSLGKEIRHLQRRKKVVGLVSVRESSVFSSADFSVGLKRPGLCAPWQAHVLCGENLSEVSLILEAAKVAKENSHWSVNLSYAAVSVAFILSARGLRRETTAQVMAAINVSALLAMAHGWWSAASLPLAILEDKHLRLPWHQMESLEVLKILKTREKGLSPREARQRYRPPAKAPSKLSVLSKLLVEELNNPLTPILSAGAGLSAIVGSLTDASMVMTVLGLNGIIGALQRFKTEETVLHLSQNHNHQRVRVNRGGKRRFIESRHLVVGDIVRLHEGDIVPADCRLLKSSSLEVDEASLTGESIPVKKHAYAVKAQSLAERSSMVYEGTAVTAGEALAIAVAVGDQTESQRIKLYETPPPPSGVEARLEGLTRFTLPVTLLSGATLVSSGLMRGLELSQVLNTGVSLAVAAIPEGLPIMATVAQLAAARRLARRGVLAQNIRSIESLGRVNVICVDKTGTLTHGHIQLEIVSDGEREKNLNELNDGFQDILAAGLLASPPPKKGRSVPHRTDQALIDGAKKVGLLDLPRLKNFKRIKELAFGPSRMFHAVLGQSQEGRKIYVKGSPEVLLEKCKWVIQGSRRQTLSQKKKKSILAKSLAMARQGRRILAVAEKNTKTISKIKDTHITQLTFRGFLAFSDPIRETAAQAVKQIKEAGMEVVMVTGDHPSTAERIAAELKILNHKRVITGEELDRLSDARLIKLLPKISVFARVDPSHKARIVKAYQGAGKNVAMTGDGTNDAAAIRMANVGIAISKHATPAARKVADLVITDSKMETILEVVLEGRGLWASVREAVSVLVGGNLGEIGFTLLLGLISGDSPLNPRQLLLVNLLTDVAPALVIASKTPQDKSVQDLLKEGPDVSLGEPLTEEITWRALFTALAAGSAWLGARLTGTANRARTVGLLALVGTQLGQTLLAGGKSKGVWAAGLASISALVGIVQTPGLSGAFGCQPVGPVGWSIASGSALSSIFAALLVPRFFPELPKKIGKIKTPGFMKKLEDKMTMEFK